MKHSRCKCGKCESWSSGFYLPCSPCDVCGTNADGSEVKAHEFNVSLVPTDEGMKSLSRCIWCTKTKAELNK